MTRYKLFRGIIFDKKEFKFLNEHFSLSNCQILLAFLINFSSNSFRIRSCSDPGMNFYGFGSCKKFLIRLDSQRCR
jgi:hypothetical protein